MYYEWLPLFAFPPCIMLPYCSVVQVLSLSSSFVYAKLLALWLIVLFADYFLEFRFEYLWPFWLFLRSVYDSFKYQGLVRSNLPIVPALPLLLLFIPGFFSILHLHCHHFRHDLLSLHPGPLAVLRGQHLRLGPVRLAHRYIHQFITSLPVYQFKVYQFTRVA